MVYHNHLLVNGYTLKKLTDGYEMNKFLTQLVKYIGMKIVIPPRSFYIKKAGNKGITAQVGIETSHLAIHVWDEPSPSIIRLDLYTCGCLDVDSVLAYLEEHLGLINYKFLVVNREDDFKVYSGGKE